MRRNEKEIIDKDKIIEILQNALICRIGLFNDRAPYIVPMNFVYHENSIYLHSAKEGKKIDLIKKNNNICFELDMNNELMSGKSACNYGMKFLSIIGIGKAFFIEDFEEKKNVLLMLMKKHTGRELWELPDESVKKILIIKIIIDSLNAKKSGYE